MIERYIHNKIIWLDVVNPTQEEIHSILEECAVPREFAGDLTTMTPKTEVFSKKDFLKITLDFPIVKRTDINHPHEVKFLVTKKHLITIRFEDIEAIHHFSKDYEVLAMLNGKAKTATETVFLSMLNRMYDATYAKLDYLESKLKDIEEEIFKEHEEAMVYELSRVSRRLIVFKQTMDAHDDALQKLAMEIEEAFGKKHEISIAAIMHQYDVIKRRLHALISTLNDLLMTNDSVLTTKQNGFMRVFTILAFITFPLTLLSSMFGMNTQNTPIVGNPIDFWIIVAIMISISIGFFIFFRYKKWL
jgi:magnesium transporter